MLKLSIRNQERDILDELLHLNDQQIKSRWLYPGYDHWFEHVFIPDYLQGNRDIISVRDKRYGTLTGFALLKLGGENKVCNLSPLLDGVGMTQALLDSTLHYFDRDYQISVPMDKETVRLHSKLSQLGFVVVSQGYSTDQVLELTYQKAQTLSWV